MVGRLAQGREDRADIERQEAVADQAGVQDRQRIAMGDVHQPLQAQGIGHLVRRHAVLDGELQDGVGDGGRRARQEAYCHF